MKDIIFRQKLDNILMFLKIMVENEDVLESTGTALSGDAKIAVETIKRMVNE